MLGILGNLPIDAEYARVPWKPVEEPPNYAQSPGQNPRWCPLGILEMSPLLEWEKAGLQLPLLPER